MFKLYLISVLIVSIPTPVFARDDFGPGNSGMTVRCEQSSDPKDPAEGLYSLDYLVAANTLGSEKVVPVRTFQESLKRIERLLLAKVPDLGESFKKFRSYLSNRDDRSQKRIWPRSDFKLPSIEDSDRSYVLPENCAGRLTQTIIRSEGGQQIEYDSHRDTFLELEKSSSAKTPPDEAEKAPTPLNLSFIYVHEWLWDYTKDPIVNRKVNWYLHTNFLETDGEDKVVLVLFNLQLGKFKFRTHSDIERYNRYLENQKITLQALYARLQTAVEKCALPSDAIMKQMKTGEQEAQWFRKSREGQDELEKLFEEAEGKKVLAIVNGDTDEWISNFRSLRDAAERERKTCFQNRLEFADKMAKLFPPAEKSPVPEKVSGPTDSTPVKKSGNLLKIIERFFSGP